MVDRFRKADLHVVYADFNRMIVATKTARVELAQHRVGSLLEAIKGDPVTTYSFCVLFCIRLDINFSFLRTKTKNKTKQNQLFAWLDVIPSHSAVRGGAWSTLLFYDAANYCGMPAPLPGSAPEPIESVHVVSHWNIAEHLPRTVADRFLAVVSHFTVDVETRRRQRAAAGSASTLRERSLAGDNVPPPGGASMLAKSDSVPAPDDGSGLLHDRTFRSAMIRFVSESSDASSADKIEFVKATCEILGLDSESRETVHLLKQLLLRPLNLTAFAPRAKFVDPCRSLVLPDVVCTFW